MPGSASASACHRSVGRSGRLTGRGSLGRRISPDQGLPPSVGPPPFAAGPPRPPDAPTAPGGTRSCVRKTSGPSPAATPARRPAGQIGPVPWECPICAFPRSASGCIPASPVAACRSRSITVPGWLASAPAGARAVDRRSSRPPQGSRGSLGLVLAPACSSPARRLALSNVRC